LSFFFCGGFNGSSGIECHETGPEIGEFLSAVGESEGGGKGKKKLKSAKRRSPPRGRSCNKDPPFILKATEERIKLPEVCVWGKSSKNFYSVGVF
jgi:hypothetical protein